MTDPRIYDYAHADRFADLVMKGGITSGVIYPHAVCEIARTYRLRNVGGTSAGAIAAAVAAAAECGRSTGGFAKMASFPGWLGTGRNLFSLFQPQKGTERLFRILTAQLGARNKFSASVIAILRRYPGWAILGALPGLLLAAASVLEGGLLHRILTVLAPLALAVGGASAGVLFAMYRDVVRGIPTNLLGLCTGMPGPGASAAALTPWLTDLLDHVAGLDKGSDAPLTFGDLERADVNLEMVTTSLSHGRPYRLPLRSRAFFFDPIEFRRLFPERVVAWMEAHPPPPPPTKAAAAEWELYCRLLRPLRAMPAVKDLPVVVATRLSLSFPVLISAVPLWSVDFTRDANIAAEKAWTEWIRTHRPQWSDLCDTDVGTWPHTPGESYSPERCWFSDGGIVSNFPVHFFDQALPKWPTFAINLRPFHPDRQPSERQADNVWMPTTNSAGVSETWTRWAAEGRAGLTGFGHAILTAMQNWSDNSQLRVPGYRDRIAHVSHTAKEGGMNLTMEPDTVLALSERGRAAGEELVVRFTGMSDSPLTWDNHRWVRFRSAMSLLDQTLRGAAQAYACPSAAANETSYPDLLVRAPNQPPPAYRWADKGQQAFASAATNDLITVVKRWESDGETFTEDAPREPPRLRIMPEW